MSPAVQQIKDRLDIVTVVSAYLKLEKAGQNWKARCPFHQEKTPSFFVSPARGSFHCFGCDRGGDIFTFVQEMEGVDFLGALKILADQAGVKIEAASLGADRERARLYEVLARAAEFYRAELARQPAARRYLADRGVSEASAAKFSLGFAPAPSSGGWQSLVRHLRERGYRDEELERAGLALRSQRPATADRLYDRFRGRLIFPLADASGRVVGFSGRIFPADSKVEGGKYVNSPQTEVYDKGRLLYGFPEAKVEIRRRDQVILVEGQFDLILSQQAGFANTVAVSGTALTERHLEALSRLTRNLVMAFDGDAAGVAAASRAIVLGLSLGFEVKVAALPPGSDPAEIIKRDPDAWRRSLEEAKHLIDFLLDAAMKREADERARAHLIKREVYPYLIRLRERIDRAHFIAKVASSTGLSEAVIEADLADLKRDWRPEKKPVPPSPPPRSRLGLIDERLNQSAFLEPSEVEDLKAERAREELKEQLKEAVANLAAAERRRDEPEAAVWLARCRDLSRELNRLNNKVD